MWDELEIEYDRYQLKENILTQGESIRRTLNSEADKVTELSEKLREARQIILTGAGDKHIIPLISQYMWRNINSKPIEVFHSRQLLDDNIKVSEDTIIIYLSQSGSTYDTLEAFKKYKDEVKLSIWITNLKEEKKGSIYESRGEKCEILTTHTVLYPEKPIISTSTFHTTLALLNFLLLSMIPEDENALILKQKQKNEIPKIVENLSKNTKIIEWAKDTAMKLRKFRENSFYVLGDGIRYFIARKQARIMFMEGCKQNACSMETEDFVHSLIETLEPYNPKKEPLILIKPEMNFASKHTLNLIEFVISTWQKYAGEDKTFTVTPYEFTNINLTKQEANLFSPFTYIVPLEWLTYYYALSLKVDPGESLLVKKVRADGLKENKT